MFWGAKFIFIVLLWTKQNKATKNFTTFPNLDDAIKNNNKFEIVVGHV